MPKTSITVTLTPQEYDTLKHALTRAMIGYSRDTNPSFGLTTPAERRDAGVRNKQVSDLRDKL